MKIENKATNKIEIQENADNDQPIIDATDTLDDVSERLLSEMNILRQKYNNIFLQLKNLKIQHNAVIEARNVQRKMSHIERSIISELVADIQSRQELFSKMMQLLQSTIIELTSCNEQLTLAHEKIDVFEAQAAQNKESAKTPTKTPSTTSIKAAVEIQAKTPAKSPANTPAKLPTKTPSTTSIKASAETQAKTKAKSPAKTPAKSPTQTPPTISIKPKTPGIIPSKTPISANNKSVQSEDDEEIYEVERLLNHKNRGRVRYFLVRWKGFGESHDSWEKEANLSCPTLLQTYKNEKKLKK